MELATTIPDLEAAFELVYDQYQKMGITETCDQSIRCNLYTFLPHSSVIVAKYEDEVIGTVSLIRDSEFGLPSDMLYKKENDEILKDADTTKAEAALAGKKNDAFDRAEIALQVAVVLCSLTLLTGSAIFSQAGVALAALGVVLAGMAFFQKPDAPKSEAQQPSAVTAPAVPAGGAAPPAKK